MFCIFIILLNPPLLSAQEKKGDGRLFLYNFQTGDVLETTYRTKDGYDRNALAKIYKLMRSPDGETKKISIKLIELLDEIQDYFGAETIEIISGYRSQQYNKNLIISGRNVAKESLHLMGMAADIHIDEITEKALGDYVVTLNGGGVGFYPRQNFVHVDVGPVRRWGEDESNERILTGLEANPNYAWKAITDKDIYFKNEKLEIEVTNVSYEKMSLTKNIWVEHFRKGNWSEHFLLEKKRGKKRIVDPGKSVRYKVKLPPDARYGKYRLVLFTSEDFNTPPVISNEFYLKKE